MDPVSVIHALKDFTDNCGSTSLSRLKELAVKLHVAEHKQVIRSTGQMLSQHRTAVVSHYTLMEILKRRSQHLRMYPEYKGYGLV